jgi:hypothetical protein
MNQSIQETPSHSGRSGKKSLAMFCTVLVAGIALYASRSGLLRAPADDPKDKRPAAPTRNAVTAANKFLDALDAK